MKAQFVSENLQFKRGGEVKQTLGIGYFKMAEDYRIDINNNRNPDYPLEWNKEGGWIDLLSGYHAISNMNLKSSIWLDTIPLDLFKYIMENIVDNLDDTLESHGGIAGKYDIFDTAIEGGRIDIIEYLISHFGLDYATMLKIKQGRGFKNGHWMSLRFHKNQMMDWLNKQEANVIPNIEILVDAASTRNPDTVERFMKDPRIEEGPDKHEKALYQVQSWAIGGRRDNGTLMGGNFSHFNPELTTWLLYHPKIYPYLNAYKKRRAAEALEVATDRRNIRVAKNDDWIKGYAYERYPLTHIKPRDLAKAENRLNKLNWKD